MRNWIRWCARRNPGAVLLPWLVAAATTIWLKLRALDCDAFRESAHGVRHSGVLTFWEQATLFRWDLLLGFVIIPAVLLLAAAVLPRWGRAPATALFAAGTVVALMVEETARCATGAFQSAKLLGVAAAWAWRSRDGSVLHVTPLDEIQLAALIALIVGCAAAATRPSDRWVRFTGRAAVSTFALGGVIGLALFVPTPPAMIWNQPMLIAVGRALADAMPPAADRLPDSIAELHRMHQDVSHVPPPVPSPWRARAQGYNVLFFVLETTPAQVFDPAVDSLNDMPNARWLRRRSFVATQHFTTLALTSSAVFSLFTSLYPHGPGPVGHSIGDRAIELPGMIRNLRTAGYRTGYYGYLWKTPLERDDRLITSLGFEKVVEPAIDAAADRDGFSTFKGPIEYAEQHDRETLGALLRDIHGWTAAHQKFAAAFFPEMGHDPWRDLRGAKANSMLERGHALAVYQDAWLGSLVAELKRDGALENTIIVVTADHGLRMKAGETGELVDSASSDRLIRVPLLIYAPGVLHATQRLEWPTSHVDVAPTIQELLGVAGDRRWEEGAAMWNPGLRGRRLFLSMDVFGTSIGFSEAGSYYMRASTQTVFKSDRVLFAQEDALLNDGADSARVRHLLEQENSVQGALLFHLFQGDKWVEPKCAPAPSCGTAETPAHHHAHGSAHIPNKPA